MSGNVIFSVSSMFDWVNVANNLAKKHKFYPCYWISEKKLKPFVQDRFPKAVFHDTYDAIRGVPAKSCSQISLPALDQSLIKECAYNELLALQMMNRLGWDNIFTYNERIDLYYVNLRYWLAILNYYTPTLVIFHNTPHLVYDYILYILCKNFGIKTIMFLQTNIPGLLIPTHSFDDNTENILHKYKEGHLNNPISGQELSPFMKGYLQKATGNYEQAIPYYMKKVIDNPYINITKGKSSQKETQKTTKSTIYQKPSRLGWLLRRLLFFEKYPVYITVLLKLTENFFKVPPNYLKSRGNSISESIPWWEYKLYRIQANQIKRHLKAYYESLTSSLDLQKQKPYVFVALHYQPEETTAPRGDIFVNQLLMVDILSKALPEGWLLYVKEHPVQFSRKLKGELGRTSDFYDNLIAFSNVHLVSHMISPFDLIDQSKAVATVTGTAGWEAVLRGKPALTFGFPWYKGCEGVFYTPTVQTCKDVFAAIEQGYQVQEEKVEEFIIAIDEICIRGYTARIPENIWVSAEQNCLNITRAIEQLVFQKESIVPGIDQTNESNDL